MRPIGRSLLPHPQWPALSGHDAQGGNRRTLEGIRKSLPYAETRGIVLCMENHYKDGTWQYPEFAQPEDIFCEIIGRSTPPHFGVQFDPSNATVGGFDPVKFLERARMRVVSMHASDRYLVPARRSTNSPVRWLDRLFRQDKHGETGKGLNDYDAIFRILADVGFTGWISVEDGMNGLDELRGPWNS